MKAYNLIIAGVFALLMALPAQAQKEDTYTKVGDRLMVTRYFDNGAVREEGTFLNGTPDGRWVQYDEKGNIKVEAFYSHGVKQGKWFVWSEDGDFLYEMAYADNQLKSSHKWKIDQRNVVAEK